ncbi:MAG: lysylphosphatidylglycerol synthase transmembrane domain-containing protein [Planctomycetota bacterium]
MSGAVTARAKGRPSGRRWVRRLAGVLGFALLLVLLWLYREHLAQLRHLTAGDVLLVLGLFVVFRVASAGAYLCLLRRTGCPMPLAEATVLQSVASYLSLVVPKAGGVATLAYARQTYRLPVLVHMHVLVALPVVQLAALVVLGAALFWWLDPAVGRWAVAAVFMSGLGLFGVAKIVRRIPGGAGSVAQRVARSLRYFPPRSVLACGVVFAVCTLLQAVRLHVVADALGAYPVFVGLVLLTALAQVASVVSLVPGGLGVREGILIYGATLAALDPEQAAVAAVGDRGVALAGTIGMGLIGTWLLPRWPPKRREAQPPPPREA